MESDMQKMVEMLMGIIGSSDSQNSETLNDISDDEDYNEISEETSFSESENDNSLENIFGGFSAGKDKRVTLLSSIKPYMNGKRQDKIDTAINALKLISVSSSLGFNFFDKR